MRAFINSHQLSQILAYIQREYETFATQNIDGKITFDKLESLGNFRLPVKKAVIPFKKILFPNHNHLPFDKGENERGSDSNKPLAFVGLPFCDAEALLIFYEEFKDHDPLPTYPLVVTAECKPDKYCFCTAFEQNRENIDLHIQVEKKGLSIFSYSARGHKILKDNGIKETFDKPVLEEIEPNAEKLDLKKLAGTIDNKDGHLDFWQKVSGNCFGCGACTAVCPLCYCTRQADKNTLDGKCTKCLEWDSCFSKSFSQIQCETDLRPSNTDRLYNWYHHKFVRSIKKSGYPLCTGCGRCIAACPAGLNQGQILNAITKMEERK